MWGEPHGGRNLKNLNRSDSATVVEPGNRTSTLWPSSTLNEPDWHISQTLHVCHICPQTAPTDWHIIWQSHGVPGYWQLQAIPIFATSVSRDPRNLRSSRAPEPRLDGGSAKVATPPQARGSPAPAGKASAWRTTRSGRSCLEERSGDMGQCSDRLRTQAYGGLPVSEELFSWHFHGKEHQHPVVGSGPGRVQRGPYRVPGLAGRFGGLG